MTVAELLQKSREAHLRYRQVSGKIDKMGAVSSTPNDEAARLAIVDALEYRNQAHAADPMRSDPAWAADAAANKGVSSESLRQFYRSFFVTPTP